MTGVLAGGLAAVLAGAATATSLPPSTSPAGRLRRLSAQRPPGSRPRAGAGAAEPVGPVRRRALVALPLTAVVVAVAGAWSAIPLTAVAVLVWRRRRHLAAPTRLPGSEVALFADLVSGGVAAGLRLPAALLLAGPACGEELRSLAAEVAAALDAGLPAEVAWSPASSDRGLAMVARACRRTADSGAGVGGELRRIARRLRTERRSEAERRAAKASVWLVLPLGACFLPGFVLLTVVPIVVGLLARLR